MFIQIKYLYLGTQECTQLGTAPAVAVSIDHRSGHWVKIQTHLKVLGGKTPQTQKIWIAVVGFARKYCSLHS